MVVHISTVTNTVSYFTCHSGSNYECLYADVDTNGRVNDKGVWSKGKISTLIEDNKIVIPTSKNSERLGKVPFVFLGDDVLALKPYLLEPYPSQRLTPEKRVFNYRLSRERRISENLSGILANRWRIYHTAVMLDRPVVTDIILAILALHNMLCNSPDN